MKWLKKLDRKMLEYMKADIFPLRVAQMLLGLWVCCLVAMVLSAAGALTGCAGKVEHEKATFEETSCQEELQAAREYTEEGCYAVPEEPLLSFSHFQADSGCVLSNNGEELNSFTVWDVLEPGTLVVGGCDFSLLLVSAEAWEQHGAGGER